MYNLRFGDIVVVHVYDKNIFKGYLSCKPGNPLDFASIEYDHDKIMKFCITPFGFFAEDQHRETHSVGCESFVLQQLFGGKRNKLVEHKGKLCLLETDVYNQTEQDARISIEMSPNNKLRLKVGWGYVHSGDGLFMDIKSCAEGALEFEFQVVSSTDAVRFGKGQVFRPYFNKVVTSHFHPRGVCHYF